MSRRIDVREFIITIDHIALLRRAYVGWEDCEFGAPAIDCKRPYGNSSVEYDIADILGWVVNRDDGLSEEQGATAKRIHDETQIALQIILITGKMETGRYLKRDGYDYRSWVKV